MATNHDAAVFNVVMSNPEFFANPHQTLAMLREEAPVHLLVMPNGRRIWFVTSFAYALQLLKDPAISNEAYRLLNQARDSQRVDVGENSAEVRGWLERSLLFMDDPLHARLRSLVAKSFSGAYIDSLRPRVQAIADTLIDAMQARGHADLVKDYAIPLPLNVIGTVLGVPPDEWETIGALTHAASNRQGASAERDAIMSSFPHYVAELIAHKRPHLTDDLISHIVRSMDTDSTITFDNAVGTIGLLIIAGHDTTSGLIGTGMLGLLQQPTELAKLQAGPSLIPNAIEELVRYSAPVFQTAPRRATVAFELGGQSIQENDLIAILLSSANRDPAVFADPDTIDVARKIERHLGFGHGIHYCVGAPLARLEGQIAYETLLRRLPNIQLAADPATLPWHGGGLVRTLGSLPVTF